MPSSMSSTASFAPPCAGPHSAETPAEIDLNNVQTNIVIFKVPGGKADAFVARLKQHGILASTVYRHSVRFVTHRDVDRAACEEAARVAVEILKQ